MATYKELKRQQERLTIEVEAARKVELADAIARVKETINTYGITASDLGFSGATKGRGDKTGKREPAPPKYRDPATGKTWSGHGKRPGWIVAAAGKLQPFLIAPAAGSARVAPKATKGPVGEKKVRAKKAGSARKKATTAGAKRKVGTPKV